MKDYLCRIRSILLGFVGLTATGGGLLLVLDPSGGLMKLPVDKLYGSPFNNYLIPGIVLFAVLGVGNLILLVLPHAKKQNQLAVFSGTMICGWIVIQMIIIREINWLQLTIFTCGLFIILISRMLRQ